MNILELVGTPGVLSVLMVARSTARVALGRRNPVTRLSSEQRATFICETHSATFKAFKAK